MGGSLNSAAYSVPTGVGHDVDLGAIPWVPTALGAPPRETSPAFAAAPADSPAATGDAMRLADELLRAAPIMPDPWATARPMSASDLVGLLPSAPSPGHSYAMMLADALFRAAPRVSAPWSGARPINRSDLDQLRPMPPVVSMNAPATMAENFGWLGMPVAPGTSPYDPSAAPPVTAENFGWQGLPKHNSAESAPSSSLAVIYGGSRGDSGNPLGHIAIAVEGRGIFSFGTKTLLGSSTTDYMNSQGPTRDMVVVTIPTKPGQNKAVLDYMRESRTPQGIGYFDNCANRTGTALMRAGILPYPEILSFPPLPANVLMQAINADGATVTYLPRNGSPPDLSKFNPQ